MEFSEFMDWEMLTTFAGMVIAVGLIVQFTKSLLKGARVPDWGIRLYALVIALVIHAVMLYRGEGFMPEDVTLAVVNSVIVTVTAMGGYEAISDPKAE